MRLLRIIIGVLVGLAVAGFIIQQRSAPKFFSEDLAKESQLQVAEVAKCKENLRTIYTAWKKYKDDHKGSEPPTHADLFPKYLKDSTIFVCPTAERWKKAGKPLAEGVIVMDRRNVSVTYGFKWMTSGQARARKTLKDKAPLAVCESHEDALFRAAMHRSAHTGEFGAENRSKLPSEVAKARQLAVLENGSVVETDPTTE